MPPWPHRCASWPPLPRGCACACCCGLADAHAVVASPTCVHMPPLSAHVLATARERRPPLLTVALCFHARKKVRWEQTTERNIIFSVTSFMEYFWRTEFLALMVNIFLRKEFLEFKLFDKQILKRSKSFYPNFPALGSARARTLEAPVLPLRPLGLRTPVAAPTPPRLATARVSGIPPPPPCK